VLNLGEPEGSRRLKAALRGTEGETNCELADAKRQCRVYAARAI
jgi:hypothetical protein